MCIAKNDNMDPTRAAIIDTDFSRPVCGISLQLTEYVLVIFLRIYIEPTAGVVHRGKCRLLILLSH